MKGWTVNWLHAVILGIVEGITEFLPVSSTGHLRIVEKLLGYDIQGAGITAFTAIIQVGAILAAIVYFWSDIVRIVVAWAPGGAVDTIARRVGQRLSEQLGKPVVVENKSGATGTIGRATLRALTRRGHDVVCFVRPRPAGARPLDGAEVRTVEMRDPAAIARDGFRGEAFDAVVSCMASRTGAPRDAWAVDHRMHVDALAAARDVGVRHFVLLSAICVQKPLLAFQRAKLAFEAALAGSGLAYSIVRPTAKAAAGRTRQPRAARSSAVAGVSIHTFSPSAVKVVVSSALASSAARSA